jgi:hypothetical protein
MVLAGAYRPLSEIEDLELRRHRLTELIELELVSPHMCEQIKKAIVQIESQIRTIQEQPMRIAA